MTTVEKSKLIEYLKVIADVNRLAILSILKNGPLCVCEIFPKLKLSQNLVSHHLKVLKEMGLIEDTRDGIKIFYSRNEKTIEKYQTLLNKKI